MTESIASVKDVDPIFVSVKDAARILGVSPWRVYQLCDTREVESRYQGRRRLVVYKSLVDFADRLPTYPVGEPA